MDWTTIFMCKPRTLADHAQRLGQRVPAGYVIHRMRQQQINGKTLTGMLYHKAPTRTEPDWLDFAGGLIGARLRTGNPGDAHSAIMLVAYGNDTFVLTYGTAHSIAKKLNIHRKFGRIVVANGKDTDEVRALAAQVYGPHGKERIERRPHGGPTAELQLPRFATNTKKLAAKVTAFGETLVAEGGTGFRFTSPATAQDLGNTLDLVLQWWNGGADVDAEIQALDRVEEVCDEDELDRLNALLETAVRQRSFAGFSLSLDAEELWSATGFNYRASARGPLLTLPNPLTARDLVIALEQGLQGGMAMDRVKLIADRGANRVYEGYALDNLSFEPPGQAGTDRVLYDDGGWYQITNQWAVAIAQDVNIVETASQPMSATLGLPAWTGGTEVAYMDLIVQILGAARAKKLHTKWPAAGPKVEPCDVLVDGSYFLFMKKKHSFGAVAEVAAQAVQAATAMIEDATYRAWLATQLAPQGWQLDLDNRRSYNFILLIMSSPNALRQGMTVRAHDCISMCLHELKGRYQFNVGVICV